MVTRWVPNYQPLPITNSNPLTNGLQSIISNGYYDTGSWEIRMGREGGGTMLGGGFITADHGTAWDHVGDFYSDHDTLQGRVPPAALDAWNHVAMTYDGEVVHFYVNGVQQGGIMNDSGDVDQRRDWVLQWL